MLTTALNFVDTGLRRVRAHTRSSSDSQVALGDVNVHADTAAVKQARLARYGTDTADRRAVRVPELHVSGTLTGGFWEFKGILVWCSL